jgi:peptidoglycan/xylan/chitin deacetylase (PgdA/CDA1 family)
MSKISKWLFILIIVLQGCSGQPEPLSEGKVVVLLYHRISAGEATNLYERSAADFEGDLRYLRENDITVISFEDLEKMLERGTIPHNNAAIITFDDGDNTWLTQAKPLLVKYDMKATFFLWVSRMGMNSYLTWDEVTAMSHYADGNGERLFVFGSHTMSHHYLLSVKASTDAAEFDRYLDAELGTSAVMIEEHTPAEVSVLALPFGDGAGDTDIIEAARRNGFRFIRTSERGVIGPTGTDPFRLPSLPMLNDTEPEAIGTWLGR